MLKIDTLRPEAWWLGFAIRWGPHCKSMILLASPLHPGMQPTLKIVGQRFPSM